MTKILLLQGANMVWLGQREPELYGTTTANELDAIMHARAASAGITVAIFYANIEGEAIARIYQAVEEGVDAISPGGGGDRRCCRFGHFFIFAWSRWFAQCERT